MRRLTKEREQEIRKYNDMECHPDSIYGRMFSELLSEIDIVRNENVAMTSEIDHYKTVWEDAIIMIGEVEQERDQLKVDNQKLSAENEKLKEDAIHDAMNAKVRRKENEKLRERVEKLREALTGYCGGMLGQEAEEVLAQDQDEDLK